MRVCRHSSGSLPNKPNRCPVENRSKPEIIGKTVVDNQNQKVGKVEDLLMDNGRCIGYVILSHGGLLGIGEKYVPIPWSQFASQGGKVRVDSSGDIMVNISKERLEKAPNFAKSDWKDASSAELRQKIDQYYAEGGMQRKLQGARHSRGTKHAPGKFSYERAEGKFSDDGAKAFRRERESTLIR